MLFLACVVLAVAVLIGIGEYLDSKEKDYDDYWR